MGKEKLYKVLPQIRKIQKVLKENNWLYQTYEDSVLVSEEFFTENFGYGEKVNYDYGDGTVQVEASCAGLTIIAIVKKKN